MPRTFSREEVQRIASLARIALTAGERDLLARQLGEILAYAEQIGAVDTSRVPDAAEAPLPSAGVDGRADEIRPSLDRDAALDAAPDADLAAGFFKVPRVLG